MLECPFCREKVPHEGMDHWFKCPECKKWLCPRLDQNGLRWIESRVPENTGVQPDSSKPPSFPSDVFPNVSEMDLPKVQKELDRTRTKLHELDHQDEKNKWQEYENQLKERELELSSKESEYSESSSSSNTSGGNGLVFGCGTILAGAGIFVFTLMINLHLDIRAYMVLIVIALVSGLLTLLISQFNR